MKNRPPFVTIKRINFTTWTEDLVMKNILLLLLVSLGS